LAGENIKTFGELMKKRVVQKKAPTYQWQELALKIIQELDVPANKRSSVFKVCKQYNKLILERAFSDTKELCKSGEKWRYFFKVIDIHIQTKPNTEEQSQ
jgi:hypothetical protein